MALEDQFKHQAQVLDLLQSAKLDDATKAASEAVLSTPKVLELVTSEPDLQLVKSKLEGRRVQNLSDRQAQIVSVVNYLHTFERCVGAWLATNPKRPYAVEHILGHFDIDSGELTTKGTGFELIRKASFDDLQTLRTYSKFAKQLTKIYGRGTKGDITYTNSADKVARMLVGRHIIAPSSSLDNTVSINAWNAFIKGENEDYEPTMATIVETEGFETEEDVTPSRYCMLAAPGQLDIMPTRGHKLLNVGSYKTGEPSCVMLRAISIDDAVVDGPGRVSDSLFAESLIGKFLGVDVLLEGITSPSGYIPGTAGFSTGKYRMQ